MVGPLLGRAAGKEAEMVLPVISLEADEGESRVEEEVELVHTGLEDLGKGEMPQLVREDEEGEAGDQP